MSKAFPKSYLMETPEGDCVRLQFDMDTRRWESGTLALQRHSGQWSLNVGTEEYQCEDGSPKIDCAGYTVHNPDLSDPKGLKSRKRARKSTGSRARVGDHLKAIIKEQTGATPKLSGPGKSCGCNDLAKKMNTWGIEGCSTRKAEILDHLVNIASDLTGFNNVKSIYKIAAALPLPEMVIRKVAEAWVDSAIALAKAELARIQRSRPSTISRNQQNANARPAEPRPFTEAPSATLLFHIYPTHNWRKHVDYMNEHAVGYSRKIMSIAVDEHTANANEVKDAFGGSWEYITVPNDPQLREVLSYRELFKLAYTEDPNHIIVCAHGKGAQAHTVGNESIRWWTNAMYETVVGNLSELYEEFEKGYNVVGSFRRIGRQFGCKHRYHFSGTFYALRASGFFLPNGKIPPIRQRWWGTESLPGDTIPFQESKCIVGDGVGDMYKEKNHPVKEFEEWKESKHNATRA